MSLHNPVMQRARLMLGAVKSGFISLMPLNFLGLFVVLVQNLPFAAYQQGMAWLFGSRWVEQIGLVAAATQGIFGMGLAITVSVHLFRRIHDAEPGAQAMQDLVVGIAGLINFMMFVLIHPISSDSFGHGSMLLGIVVGLGTAEVLSLTLRLPWDRWFRLPYETGTDTQFYYAMYFSAPVMLCGAVSFLLVIVCDHLPPFPHHLLAPLAIWAQAQGVGDWCLSLVATAINQMFWFIGINGGNVLDHYGVDLFLPSGQTYSQTSAWRPLLDHFSFMGGSGATAGLIIAILLKVRSGPQQRLAWLALLPALFNINEVVLYGLPIVLNPIYALPFLGIPILLTLLTVAAAHFGFLEFLGTGLAWTTPSGVSGWLLTGSWQGPLWQLFEIGLSVLLYLPAVCREEAYRRQRETAIFDEALESIVSQSQSRRVSNYSIEVGLVARGLLADLRRDMEQRSPNLYLMYQPKHDSTGMVVGVEALLRWNHPRKGPIPPMVFVTLAEDSGDICALGLWALNEACECKARWNAQGLPSSLHMAVNLSPMQLSDAALSGALEHNLVRNGLSSGEVELEITESSALPEGDASDLALQKLSQSGVRLSMDDFGMGYSSLLYLRRFRVHAIKIDGSLTRDVLNNETNAAIIHTIASLGRQQHAEVVAEYVETEAQRDKLLQLGCNVFQGYLYSPALIEKACVGYIRDRLVEGSLAA